MLNQINKIKNKLFSFNWKEAKTYKKFKHEYVVMDKNKDFIEITKFIDENGIEMNFFKKKYKYIFLNDYKFWYIENILNREYFYHFGEHLTFDCYGCNPEKLDDKKNVENFLNESVNILGMKKLGDVIVYKAKPKEKDPGGYSGFVVIEESHISTHTFTKKLFNTIDFYSCKEALIYKNLLIQLVKKFFEPKTIEFNYIIRGKNYPKNNLI